VDNDGVITKDEFKMYRDDLAEFGIEDDEEWGHILKAIDSSNSDTITYMEFITAAIDHRKLLTKENMQKVFNLIDKDKNG